MEDKEPVKTSKEDFDRTVQKTIEDLVKILKAPPKPGFVEQRAEHYFVIG